MKKTILALAAQVAILAAGTAHAGVSLYNQDGVSVNVSGAAEIQYIKNYNVNKDPYLRIDDADLIFTTSVEISENLKAVAGLGFKFEGDTSDTGTTENDELYVGLSGNFGTLTFGRQLLIADDMGNANDYELGTIQIGTETSAANQAIKWVYDQGMFYTGLDVALDPNNDVGDRQIVGARIGVRPAPGLDARLYYYDGRNFGNSNQPASVFDQTVYNFEVDYSIGQFEVAASYGHVENDYINLINQKQKQDYMQLSGVYNYDNKTSFAIGVDFMDGKKGDVKQEGLSYYTNVTYRLHPNARVYAEIGNGEQKESGKDTVSEFGYLVGMEVKF